MFLVLRNTEFGYGMVFSFQLFNCSVDLTSKHIPFDNLEIPEIEFNLVMEYPMIKLEPILEPSDIHKDIQHILRQIDSMFEYSVENMSALHQIHSHVLTNENQSV